MNIKNNYICINSLSNEEKNNLNKHPSVTPLPRNPCKALNNTPMQSEALRGSEAI